MINEVALAQTWIMANRNSQLLISEQVTHRNLVCRLPPGAPASTAADYAATPQTSFPHPACFPATDNSDIIGLGKSSRRSRS